MRVVVPEGLCQGHGQCTMAAPDIYILDDDGYVEADGSEVPPGEEARAERGASACPERAITLLP